MKETEKDCKKRRRLEKKQKEIKKETEEDWKKQKKIGKETEEE